MKLINIKSLAFLALSALPFSKANAQAFTENFDNIATLPGSGWVTTNSSVPVGSIPNWFQGTSVAGGGPFDAYNGATNAYIAANYNMTTGANTISAWMITPNRTFRNGDVLTFYTRKASPDTYYDRLEVRMSTNGASTNVGSGSTAVGDFTTLLVSVNPSLVGGVYPVSWTQYTITISGLAAPTSGRMAFRYFVTNGGPSGLNSDYIGVDNVNYVPYVCPSFTMTPSGALTGATAGAAYSTSLSQTGALGTPTYAVTAGALPPGTTLSTSGTISGTPTATGTFSFTVTVSDASGCSGSTGYSITSVCGPNPTSLSGLPAVCDNAGTVSLSQGSPAGGTYSGTGVTGTDFDPAAGTQTITYNYTDPYGCAYASSSTLTVNTAPVVTQSPVAGVCDNAGTVTLSGASPAGGTYSGTGVTGGDFDPAAGTQTLNYAYTDANGCSNDVDFTVTVNTAPVVTQFPVAAVCDNAGTVALSGASPAGGTYSGTGVSGSSFDPSAGTQTLNYMYTDVNGCLSDVDFTVTVNNAPVVTQSPIPAVCADAGAVTLSGGSPAGGIYSGTGVSGGMFDPSAGTQTITYSVTDGNGCMDMATTSVTVNPLPSVDLNMAVTQLCVYNNAITLSGGTPAGGTYTGTGVSGGSFNPATAGLGTHTVMYAFSDANGCDASATQDITVGACLGLEEQTGTALMVYPNPSNGLFTVAIAENSIVQNAVITDLQGKTVQQLSALSTGEFSVNLSAVENGIYFLRAQVNGESISVRLVKN